MFISSISASRADIIDQCLWKYYLRYVLHIEGLGSTNEESVNFGSYIHRIFELGYLLDKKELIKLSEQLKETYKIPFTLKDRTTKCIENFYAWNKSLGETYSTEHKYEVMLDEAHDIKGIGVIDRIVPGKDGGYLVIDYKTSKREKTKKELLKDSQLMGYAYFIHTKFNVDYTKIWCAHYYPVTGHFFPVQFTRMQIDNWKKSMINRVWKIRKKKKDEFPAQVNMFCDWCEYHPVCPKMTDPAKACKRLDEEIQKQEEKKRLKEEAERLNTPEVPSNQVLNDKEDN